MVLRPVYYIALDGTHVVFDKHGNCVHQQMEVEHLQYSVLFFVREWLIFSPLLSPKHFLNFINRSAAEIGHG